MADKNRFEENKGPQQGNAGNDKALGNRSDAGSTSTDLQKSRLQTVESNENMEDDIRPADARDLRDENIKIGLISDVDTGNTRTSAFDEPRKDQQTPTQPMKDKGDMGKEGSMREQLSSEEGFRTMDEDENADDSLKKGDNKDTLGNP